MTTRGTRTLVASLVLVALAACGGGDDDEETLPTSPPTEGFTSATFERMSAQATDLPSGYQRDAADSGRKTAQECFEGDGPEERALADQMQPLGLEACYSANYTKEEGQNSNDVGSGALLFRDADGATRAMPLLRSSIADAFETSGGAEAGTPEDIAVSGLGDEALPGLKLTFDLGSREAATVFYLWRSSNVVAFYGGSDVLGDMTAQSMLDVAKKIDERATG